jgi:hypothetical protein
VRRDESVKTSDVEPASDQPEPEDVLELNEIVSANAAIGLINNTKRAITATLRMRVLSSCLRYLYSRAIHLPDLFQVYLLCFHTIRNC